MDLECAYECLCMVVSVSAYLYLCRTIVSYSTQISFISLVSLQRIFFLFDWRSEYRSVSFTYQNILVSYTISHLFESWMYAHIYDYCTHLVIKLFAYVFSSLCKSFDWIVCYAFAVRMIRSFCSKVCANCDFSDFCCLKKHLFFMKQKEILNI